MKKMVRLYFEVGGVKQGRWIKNAKFGSQRSCFIFVRCLHLKLIVSAEGSEKNKKKEKRKKEVKKEGRNFINAFSSCECDNKLKMAYCDI